MSSEYSSEPLIRVMALHALAYCERLLRRKHFGKKGKNLMGGGVVAALAVLREE